MGPLGGQAPVARSKADLVNFLPRVSVMFSRSKESSHFLDRLPALGGKKAAQGSH